MDSNKGIMGLFATTYAMLLAREIAKRKNSGNASTQNKSCSTVPSKTSTELKDSASAPTFTELKD